MTKARDLANLASTAATATDVDNLQVEDIMDSK